MLQARFTLSFITAKRLPVSPAAVRPAQLGGDSSTGSLLPWAQSQSVGSPISVLPRGGRSTPYIIPCPGTGSHCSQRLWRHAAGCCCEALLQAWASLPCPCWERSTARRAICRLLQMGERVRAFEFVSCHGLEEANNSREAVRSVFSTSSQKWANTFRQPNTA